MQVKLHGHADNIPRIPAFTTVTVWAQEVRWAYAVFVHMAGGVSELPSNLVAFTDVKLAVAAKAARLCIGPLGVVVPRELAARFPNSVLLNMRTPRPEEYAVAGFVCTLTRSKHASKPVFKCALLLPVDEMIAA